MGMVSGDNRVGDEVCRCLMRPIYSMITTHKFLGELSAASGAKFSLREKPVPTRKKKQYSTYQSRRRLGDRLGRGPARRPLAQEDAVVRVDADVAVRRAEDDRAVARRRAVLLHLAHDVRVERALYY